MLELAFKEEKLCDFNRIRLCGLCVYVPWHLTVNLKGVKSFAATATKESLLIVCDFFRSIRANVEFDHATRVRFSPDSRSGFCILHSFSVMILVLSERHFKHFQCLPTVVSLLKDTLESRASLRRASATIFFFFEHIGSNMVAIVL